MTCWRLANDGPAVVDTLSHKAGQAPHSTRACPARSSARADHIYADDTQVERPNAGAARILMQLARRAAQTYSTLTVCSWPVEGRLQFRCSNSWRLLSAGPDLQARLQTPHRLKLPSGRRAYRRLAPVSSARTQRRWHRMTDPLDAEQDAAGKQRLFRARRPRPRGLPSGPVATVKLSSPLSEDIARCMHCRRVSAARLFC